MAENEGGTAVIADPAKTDNPPAEQVTLAGKFKTIGEFDKGFRELHAKLELPPLGDKPIIGKEGLYEDAAKAEAAYKRLEVLHGKATAKPPKTTKGAKEAPVDDKLGIEPKSEGDTAPEKSTLKGVAKVLQAAGLAGKEQELADGWKANGKLTDEQYAAFEKAGRDREEIDDFFKGQLAMANLRTAQVENVRREAASIAGGDSQLQTLRTWAAANIPAERLDRLNKQVEADAGFYPDYVRLVAAEYNVAVGAGKAQPLIAGSGQPAAAPGAKDSAEFTALTKQAGMGNKAAIDKIRATPQTTIDSWKR